MVNPARASKAGKAAPAAEKGGNRLGSRGKNSRGQAIASSEKGASPKGEKKAPVIVKEAQLVLDDELPRGEISEDEILDAEMPEDELVDDLPGEGPDSVVDLELDGIPSAGFPPEGGNDSPFGGYLEADAQGAAGAVSLPARRHGGGLVPLSARSPERVHDSLRSYLREINQFPLLKPEEEVEFARRVKESGDPDAAFRLVSSHLRLVVRIAMDFQRRWMQNVLDLIQEGNIGLVRAVSKFDPDKGIKFSYYATFWVKAYILKFIMDNWRLVKIGTTQTQRKLFYNLSKERQRLIAQGFDPDAKMLAESLDVSEEQIIEMEQRLDSTDLSLDAPLGDDNGSQSRMDALPSSEEDIENAIANSQISQLVRDRLETLMPLLSDKEQFILQNRLLTDDPVTLREIGDKFSVTRERVRQIEARLLQKVREHLETNISDFSRDWIVQ